MQLLKIILKAYTNTTNLWMITNTAWRESTHHKDEPRLHTPEWCTVYSIYRLRLSLRTFIARLHIQNELPRTQNELQHTILRLHRSRASSICSISLYRSKVNISISQRNPYRTRMSLYRPIWVYASPERGSICCTNPKEAETDLDKT
jgi:hypothetical protein